MKDVSMTLKLPEDIHKKLKIMSVLSGTSMTGLIVEWVEKKNVTYNEPGKTKGTRKTVKAVEHPEIKEAILKLKAEGLSLQKICDRLEADGVASARGGKWNRGTVARMIKRWESSE